MKEKGELKIVAMRGRDHSEQIGLLSIGRWRDIRATVKQRGIAVAEQAAKILTARVLHKQVGRLKPTGYNFKTDKGHLLLFDSVLDPGHIPFHLRPIDGNQLRMIEMDNAPFDHLDQILNFPLSRIDQQNARADGRLGLTCLMTVCKQDGSC